jgi:hypothetical protein
MTTTPKPKKKAERQDGGSDLIRTAKQEWAASFRSRVRAMNAVLSLAAEDLPTPATSDDGSPFSYARKFFVAHCGYHDLQLCELKYLYERQNSPWHLKQRRRARKQRERYAQVASTTTTGNTMYNTWMKFNLNLSFPSGTMTKSGLDLFMGVHDLQQRMTRPQLSQAAIDARKPLPPDVLADALQDVIHKDV